MNSDGPHKKQLSVVALAGLAGSAIFLFGCKGVAVKGEKEARQQAEAVTQTYRPGGWKPDLPVLTTNSTLGDFLKYALLNQPQAEAAYYDWMALTNWAPGAG